MWFDHKGGKEECREWGGGWGGGGGDVNLNSQDGALRGTLDFGWKDGSALLTMDRRNQRRGGFRRKREEV